MTSFRIERLTFARDAVEVWKALDSKFLNWSIVYTLNGADEVYVGESLNAVTRFRQHLDTDKSRLSTAQVVVDDTFNKSVCLDLESYLIRLLAGDGRYRVLNRNDGVTDADYFGREDYRKTFREIFDELHRSGMFSRSAPEIENSDLFKLSPFKALTQDQAAAVEDILEGLFEDLRTARSSQIVIQGDPGTGKTVVAIYLMKLLSDIQNARPRDAAESDSIFADFFTEGYPEALAGFRAGLVVPQQALRTTVAKVFARTPGLDRRMVLSPFDVGKSADRFDLLVVDEAHRLSQRASQASGVQNADFVKINEKLFGRDDPAYTQLDWITRMSTHQILLVDAAQSIRPGDLPRPMLTELIGQVKERNRHYPLLTQHRVQAGADYVGYVRATLSDDPPSPQQFGQYDLRFFDDFAPMRNAILDRDRREGLARLVAGYAWEWRTAAKKNPADHDIEIDGIRMSWNSTVVDWVASPGSVSEVGSIHTIQGYDLNYAGVIIGPDLRYDEEQRRIRFDRANYFDKRGMRNNKQRGIVYSDDDILEYVRNIYAVLLTRGIKGTFIYVCDGPLREHLRQFF